MASDFDDIFGDLKEDEQFGATLPSDFDEASIFGESPDSALKTENVSKPTTSTSAPPSSDSLKGAVSTPSEVMVSTNAPSAAVGTSVSERGESPDQDDFLSWLDEGGIVPSEIATAPPSGAVDSSSPELVMDDISLDAHGDTRSSSATTGVAAMEETALIPEGGGDSPPAPLSLHVTAASVTMPSDNATNHQISLDDDDDDDDFLEKIVENAKKKASGSRESSNSALHIKSQSGATQREPTLDVEAVCMAYRDTGEIPAVSRLAFWRHAMQPAVDPKGSISMYALQTTPLDLPNQVQLRKEIESLCSSIFASKSYLEIIKSATAEDSADGARLHFIDNVEILITHLCKRLQLDSYPTGLALTFAPLIATGGNDPLRLELVETLFVVCQCILPHLPKHLLAHSVAEARRPLLKWLLLYHAPEIAFHLDQHFHTWNLAVTESTVKGQSTTGEAPIQDSWIASMFESESYHDFDFLTKVWDCCLLAESNAMGGPGAAKATAMSTCMSFIVVHLIAMRGGKKLLRMEGDQLRHCMRLTLIDALKEVSSGHLTQEVQRLIDSTPSGFRSKLCEVGYAPPPPAPAPIAATPQDNPSKRSSTTNLGMSLISASTTGVKELSSAMIDMPTKLLFMGSSLMTSGTGAASAEAKEEATQKQNQLFQHISEAGDSASLAMRLAAEDVIPLVFRSFQAPIANEKIRYFIVDCRSEDELRGGQIPTAFHFDPDAVTDRQVLEHVLATLNPLKGKVHLCVMGHGYGHIVEELRQQQQQGQGANSPFALKADLFEAYATNLTRVNSALLFLTKQGFPFVSVLDGGYAAAHGLLYHSKQHTVDDLIDHDARQCEFCEHHRCITSSSAPGSSTNAVSATPESSETDPNSDKKHTYVGHDSSAVSDANVAYAGNAPSPALKTASGQLDAKALFDAHTTNPGNSYFSSFAGALKTSGKTFMNPTDSLKDSTKWLMKKTNSVGGGEQQAKAPGATSTDAKSSAPSTLPNFNKLRNSLVAMGSESLDMLKKAEQAAVAKTRAPFGGIASVAASAAKAAGTSPSTSAASTTAGTASNRPTGTSGGAGAAGERNASFQRSEEEVFTIDDDDEEDDFVGGGGNSRTSSASYSARNESFSGAGGIGSNPTSPVSSSAFTLHNVERGQVKMLKKGMRVSRVQMLPCVESPFFSGYKKKKLVTAGDSAPGRVSMLPRRLVIAENHLVVLKAERNMDDVYLVKSCHFLSHVMRMTCLKKNALMVTLYYKWRAESDGNVVEKRNSYEVQQRDEFIKAVKGALEKM